MTFTLAGSTGPNRTVAAPQCSDEEFNKAVQRYNDEQAKKLKDDLERQLKEELKSDTDNPPAAATVFSLRQKFGLSPLPAVADIARGLKGTRR